MDVKEMPQFFSENLTRDKFVAFVAACVGHIHPEEFKMIWATAPRVIRAIAYAPPPGITPDVKSLPEDQRPSMYTKLNELRRERYRPLADPAQRQYYESEN